MIQTYNGGSICWLEGIYKLKTKWAKCYIKNAFTLGVRSTQLSESLNGDLKAYLKSNLGIVELEAEYNSLQKLPTLGLKNSPLLKHTTKMYTPVIFKNFHDKYDYASATIIKYRSESQSLHEYIVGLYEKDKEYEVIFDDDNKIISCSCMKFEIFGILCCHALKAFDLLDIKRIPYAYILERWTKEAKSGLILNIKRKNVEEDVNLNVTQRYKKLYPRVVKLVAEAVDNDEAYVCVERMLEEMEKRVQNIKRCSSTTPNNEAHMSLSSGNEAVIHIPSVENLLETVKGIKKKEGQKGEKRIRGWVENQKKKKTKVTTNNNVGEKISQVTFYLYKFTFILYDLLDLIL
jgi:hypothetical protein